jgi:hypothetical protein
MSAGLAGALALGYWLGAHRAERRSAPPDNGSTTAAPTTSAGSDSVPQSNPAAAKVVEEARAGHFTEFHTVQAVLALPSAFARREALYAIAGRADLRELDTLIAEAKNLSNPADRAAALEVLYLSYVEHDPQRALRSALALPDSEARNDSLVRVGAAWARIAPQAAFQQAELETDAPVRTTLQDAIVHAWASQDAAAAFASVNALPAGVQRDQLLTLTTRELARQDPQRAAELIAKLVPADADALNRVLAVEWANSDPRAAARWIASQPTARMVMIAYNVAPLYAAQFPAEALEWASRLDRTRNGQLWSQALVGVANQDPEAAIQVATGVKDAARRSTAISAVISAIAERDPALAIRHLEKLPKGEARSQVITQIALQVAQTDPDAAVSWLKSINDRGGRTQGLDQIGGQIAQRDVEAAVRLLEEIPAEARNGWISQIAIAYMQYDVDAAVQWMKRNETALIRGNSQALMYLSVREPDAAFRFADGLSNEQQRDRALQDVISNAATTSPDVAAKWIDEIRDEGGKMEAVSQVAARWVALDPDAARKWVLSLDSSGLRDPALVQLIGAGSTDDIDPLLGQIQSPDLRMDAVLYGALRLMGEDPQAAQALLRRHPLDPQRQQQFEAMAKQQNYGRGW